jgi:hypothetical protein
MPARFEVGRMHLLLAELAHTQEAQEAVVTHLKAAEVLFQTLQVPLYVTRTLELARTYGVVLRAGPIP